MRSSPLWFGLTFVAAALTACSAPPPGDPAPRGPEGPVPPVAQPEPPVDARAEALRLLRTPVDCPAATAAEAHAALAPYVGVWRIASVRGGEVAPFGKRAIAVWGVEIRPSGRFHLLHEGLDGGPIRQVGFDVEGDFQVLGSSLNAGESASIGFRYPGGGFLPGGVAPADAGRSMDMRLYAMGTLRLERWSGPARCAESVPTPGAALGREGCAAPENGIFDHLPSREAAMASLVGRWVLCSRTFEGKDVSSKPAGIEVAADGTYYELREEAGGALERGPSLGIVEITTADDGSVVQVDIRHSATSGTPGKVAFSEAPRKLQWDLYIQRDVLSRLP